MDQATNTKLPRLGEIRTKYPKSLAVTWVLNSICSNSCSYCVPSLYAGTNHSYKWENAKKFVQRLIDENEYIHCNISGGEPTMSPFFPELVKMFYDSGNTVGITTNGVRSERYIADVSKYLNYMVFSYHPEYGDNNRLLDKIKAVHPNCRADLSIMMHPRYWDNALEFLHKAEEIPYVGIAPIRINDRNQMDITTYEYTEEQLEWFSKYRMPYRQPRENSNIKTVKIGADFYDTEGKLIERPIPTTFIADGQINFKGWKCNTGSEALYIGAEGTVHGSNCRIGEKYGHIDDPDNIVINKQPVICDGRRCDCTPDYLISKIKIEK